MGQTLKPGRRTPSDVLDHIVEHEGYYYFNNNGKWIIPEKTGDLAYCIWQVKDPELINILNEKLKMIV